MRNFAILAFILCAAVNANAAAVSTTLPGGGFSLTAGTCSNGYLEASLQMWSNSSLYFYVFLPSSSVGVGCGGLNGTLIQGLSLGPSILMKYDNKCKFLASPNYCYGFANTGAQTSGFVTSFTYQLSVSCVTYCPPSLTEQDDSDTASVQYPEQKELFNTPKIAVATNVLETQLLRQSIPEQANTVKATGDIQTKELAEAIEIVNDATYAGGQPSTNNANVNTPAFALIILAMFASFF